MHWTLQIASRQNSHLFNVTVFFFSDWFFGDFLRLLCARKNQFGIALVDVSLILLFNINYTLERKKIKSVTVCLPGCAFYKRLRMFNTYKYANELKCCALIWTCVLLLLFLSVGPVNTIEIINKNLKWIPEQLSTEIWMWKMETHVAYKSLSRSLSLIPAVIFFMQTLIINIVKAKERREGEIENSREDVCSPT